MSLQFLGIPRNGSASPTTRTFSISSSTHELADDSKDVLVQRLNDLALRLDSEEYLEDQDVSALHTDVDRMERILKRNHAHEDNHSQAPHSPIRAAFNHYGASSRPHTRDSYSPAALSPLRAAFSGYGGSPSGHHDGDLLWAPLSPPSPSSSFQLSDSPQRLQRPFLETAFEFTRNSSKKPSTQEVHMLAKEAEILQMQLSDAVRELRQRKEEMGHIQGVLITRSERAAQRLIHLEDRVRDLQEEYTKLLSNLSYLRIQLRSIEVRSEQYIPYNADAELTESIRNWKQEWAEVEMKTRNAKKRCTEALQTGVVVINNNNSG